jgi:hypothetical protein
MPEMIQMLEGLADCGGTGACAGTCARCQAVTARALAVHPGVRLQQSLGAVPGPDYRYGMYVAPSQFSARLAGLGDFSGPQKMGLLAVAAGLGFLFYKNRDRAARRDGGKYLREQRFLRDVERRGVPAGGRRRRPAYR